VIQFIFWSLTLISQVTLYSSPLWAIPQKQPSPSFPDEGPRDSVMSEMRDSHHSTSLQMLEPVLPHSPLAALPSPTFSTRSSHSLKSWRESLHHAIRPTNSRTRLISRTSFGPETRSVYSDAQSIATVSQPDGFDMWDTSSVDTQTREAVLHAPGRGTALEPIPGSRPVSPARPLDGPFPAVDEEPETGLPMPPKLCPDMSRPPSPAVSEAHIHPLFRSESPVPPPAATPGTSIVASPLSSQAITCPPRPYSRMRSHSRGASPSPLTMHSKTFSPSGSRRSSRSPSPPSRKMTPPIPEFVLNVSPRSSVSNLRAKRKTTLTSESSR
jgi:hypothetical protein